ncbi:MAG: hypothetical protein R3B99_16005 [Polyangiales bacterium]
MRTFFSLLVLLSLGLGCGDNQTFPMREPYRPGDPGPLDCVPNLDGRIDATELSPALGVSVGLLVSPSWTERGVDLVGAVIDERRVWDFSIDYADDQLARLSASALEEHWFADAFAEITAGLGGEIFVTPLDAGGRTLGVYHHDDNALALLGTASADESPPEGQSLLIYGAPVALYRFPIEPGSEHVSVGEVRGGTFRGLPYAGRDVYEVRVASAGRLELPDLAFTQAMRVDVRVTVEPAAGASTTQRQTSFLFECFGEVARATSRLDETNPDFTTAAELRRLSLE